MVLVAAAGIIAAWLWVALFGLWAAYDTPLVKFGLRLGFGVPAVGGISLSLFGLASAIIFTISLRLFFRHRFLAAAVVFLVAFLGSFIVPALFDSEPLALLASLANLWVFVLLFAGCVSLVAVFRHA